MERTIVIGVGGTGLETIRLLRRYIIENNRNLDDFSRLGCLYIDTDPQEVKVNDDNRIKWEVLGKSIALSESEYLLIDCPEIGPIIKNISSYPQIKEWFPIDELKSIDMSAKDTPGARQIRPLGRFAYFFKRDDIKGKCMNTYNRLESGTGKTQIYLCCSLSGGTGSGIFLDLAYSLREWIPNCEIFGFLVMPKLTANRGERYLANAYAALLELNYFSLDRVSYKGDDNCKVGFKIAGNNRDTSGVPFDYCYLVSPRNSSNVEMNLDALPAMIAHRIYLNFDSSFASAAQGLLNNGSLERTMSLKDPNSENKHSQNFFSFGLSKIQFPIDKITEIVAFRISSSVLSSWLSRKDVPANIYERVRNELPVLSLTDNYLFGDTDLFGTNDFPSIEKQVMDFSNQIIKSYSDPKQKNISASIKTKVTDFYSEFRNIGVLKYYRNKMDDVDGISQEIFKKIRLFAAKCLVDNELGLFYLKDFMDVLKELLINKKQEIGTQYEGFPVKKANTLSNLENVCYPEIIRAENKLINKEHAIKQSLDKMALVLRMHLQVYISMESHNFAMNLLAILIDKITALSLEIDEWQKNVTMLRDRIDKDAANRIDYPSVLA